MNLAFEANLEVPFQTVKDGFNRDLFVFLNPPWTSVSIQRFDGCRKNDEVHLRLSFAGMAQPWVSVITSESEDDKEWSFVDEGKVLPPPISFWKHRHRVIRISGTMTRIRDEIEFQTTPSFLSGVVYPALWSSFAVRPGRYKKFFEG